MEQKFRNKTKNITEYNRNYMTNRYRNDPKFREKIKKKSMECQRNRRANRIKLGLCSRCGRKKINKKWKSCEKCRGRK